MKNILLIFTLLVGTAFITDAQVKIGYVNTTEVMESMSEYAVMEKALEDKNDELQTQMESLIAELTALETELQGLMAEDPNGESAFFQMRYSEYLQKNDQIIAFEETANEDLMKISATHTDNIFMKIKKACDKVAKINGYTYIIDNSLEMVLYGPGRK